MKQENRDKRIVIIMFDTSDLIHLPYTPDLTEGGITWACRKLAGTSECKKDFSMQHLQRSISEVAVDLAFRRHLNEKSIPFHVLGLTPFTRPERYDILLGGHRCIMKTFLISNRKQITQLRSNPDSLLEAPALLSLDLFATQDHRPDDLYIFAFFLGLVAVTSEDIHKAITAGQPVFMIHLMPGTWARPANWIPLQKLSLKSECGTPVAVEIGGKDAGRNFVTTRLELPPKRRILVDSEFYSLAYIHAGSQPEARIGIHSPQRGDPYLIPSHAWSNLWIYGMDILLTGWLTHEEFRRKARVLNAGARTFLLNQNRLKNLMVPIVELNPLGRLLEKVRLWEIEKMASTHAQMEKRP
jgi:hypothetical protein